MRARARVVELRRGHGSHQRHAVTTAQVRLTNASLPCAFVRDTERLARSSELGGKTHDNFDFR